MGYPVPRRDLQKETEPVVGDVSTRQMTPEEREKYFGKPAQVIRNSSGRRESPPFDIPHQQRGGVNVPRGVKTEVNLTKRGYLERRHSGESRKTIFKSLGIGQKRFNELLDSWSIRESDAEERLLDLMTAARSSKENGQQVVEVNKQAETDMENIKVLKEENNRMGEELNEVRELMANQKEELEELQRSLTHTEITIAQKDEEIKSFTESASRYKAKARELETELELIKSRHKGALIEINRLKTLLEKTKEANDVLRGKLEGRSGEITFSIPIIDAEPDPIRQRVKVLEEQNEFMNEMESRYMDRERAVSELFDLIQAYVGFVRADLTDLIPGKDVTQYVQRFITIHQQKHHEKIKQYAAERGWKIG